MRLNGTGDAIDAHEYPATTAELVEEHGDRTIELHRGEESLGEVLDRLGEETFRSPAEVREAVQCAVCHRAIGRRHYSDRDPTTPGAAGPTPVSF